MSILVNKESKILCQGITGSQGSFHAEQCIEYGSNIVAGVTPGKGGTTHLDVPVFNSVAEATTETEIDVSMIFVPAKFAADAMKSAIKSEIELIVCITEGVPVHDMIKVKQVVKKNGTRLIGPNCPGIITVDECKLGIMPGFICEKGNIGVVSKSGTLTYEAIDQLVNSGLGQTTAIGIGGDPIIGTTMKDCLELFEKDSETEGVVIIGEIGGQMEIEAAHWAKKNMSKPIAGFIAGQTAPPGKRMGHAGAIVSGGNDTAKAKMEVLVDCGISVSESVADIGSLMKTLMN